jgi:hypothetical protein
VNHACRCADDPCVQVSEVHLSLGLSLDAVIADGGGGVEPAATSWSVRSTM